MQNVCLIMRNYDQNNIFNKEKNRFPYLPNLSIQLLSCLYSERVGCVYILMSAVVANRVGAPGEQLQQLIR